MAKLFVNIPDDIKLKLDIKAKREGKKLYELVTELLTKGVKK